MKFREPIISYKTTKTTTTNNYDKNAEKVSIFGENVRHARKQWDFTTEELASFLKISPAYLSSIERGQRTPSLDIFMRICDFLGEDMGDMLKPRSNHRITLDGSTKAKNPYRLILEEAN